MNPSKAPKAVILIEKNLWRFRTIVITIAITAKADKVTMKAIVFFMKLKYAVKK